MHASDSYEVAARELAFFMPKFKLPYVPGTEPLFERTLALIRPDVLAMHWVVAGPLICLCAVCM